MSRQATSRLAEKIKVRQAAEEKIKRTASKTSKE